MNSPLGEIARVNIASAVEDIGALYRASHDSERPGFLLTVAGCSQSGKTFLAEKFLDWLSESGTSARVLSIDDFFFPNSEPDALARARSFDLPESVDFDLLVRTIGLWRERREVTVPYLEYVPTPEGIPWTRRHYTGNFGLPSVVIVEGIFAHYRQIADLADLSVFVEGPADTVRLHRRLKRDVSERGFTAEMVHRAWESFVEPGCRQFVVPESVGSRARIDLIVNSDSSLGATGGGGT